MSTAPVLYRRIDAATFVSYDPAADAYEVVPAAQVPPLKPVTAAPTRARLSQAPSGDAAEFKRAVLLAMLEFQQRAHDAGEPEAADPYLKSLAHLASVKDAPARLRLSWASTPTTRGTYGVKAVGEGEHAGRVLYGQAAQRALANQQTRQHKQRSGDRAREILTGAYGDISRISHEDLNELATHLPALPVARLRNARVLLAASWGAKNPRRQQMVDALVEHIRSHVDEQMKAAGMVAAEPAADSEPPPQPDAPADYTKFDAILRTAKDRAQAEQIARATGVPVRPDAPAAPAPEKGSLADRLKAARGNPDAVEPLLTDLARPSVSRDDLTALAAHLSPEVQAQAKRLPKAKQLELIRQQLSAGADPAAAEEAAPAKAPEKPTSADTGAGASSLPDAKALEAAPKVQVRREGQKGLGGHSESYRVTVGGRDYLLKFDDDLFTQSEAAVATGLRALGVNAPATAVRTINGRPAVVAEWIPGAKPLNEYGAKRAVAKVPPEDIDRNLLGTFLFSMTDQHTGNLVVGSDGRLHQIDPGLAFDYGNGDANTAVHALFQRAGGNDRPIDKAVLADVAARAPAAEAAAAELYPTYGNHVESRADVARRIEKLRAVAALPNPTFRDLVGAYGDRTPKPGAVAPAPTPPAPTQAPEPKPDPVAPKVSPEAEPSAETARLARRSADGRVRRTPEVPAEGRAYLAGATPAEVEAIQRYTIGGFGGLNQALRDYKSPAGYERLDGPLQSAFARTPEFPTPVTVHRGIDVLAGDLGPLVDKLRGAALSGEPIGDLGYLSTSTDAGKRFPGNVVFEIRATRGLDLEPFSASGGPSGLSEVLLDRNARYRVAGFEQRGGRYHVKLSQVAGAPEPSAPQEQPEPPRHAMVRGYYLSRLDDVPGLTAERRAGFAARIRAARGSHHEVVDGAETVLEEAQAAAPKQPKPKAPRRAAVTHPVSDSVLRTVQDYGGIDPDSLDFKRFYGSVKDARNDGIPLQVFRKGGRGLDQLAAELHGDGAGLVPTPPDKDPSEHLLDQIRGRAHTTAADLSAQYEAAFHEHARLQQEAAEYEDAESVEAEIARLGEAALGAEGGAGLVDEDGSGAGHGRAEEAGPVAPADDDPLQIDHPPVTETVEDDSPLDLGSAEESPAAVSPPPPAPLPPPAAPARTAPRPVATALDRRLRAAVLELGRGREAVRVYLKDLRNKLPDVPSEELDRGLHAMSQRGELTFYPLDDPRQIKREDEAAAIHSSTGVPQHILYYGGIPSDGSRDDWPDYDAPAAGPKKRTSPKRPGKKRKKK